MQTNSKSQLKNRVMDVFDKLILTNMKQGQYNRQVTHLAGHFDKLVKNYMTEEEALNMIKCFKNTPVYDLMLKKYEVLKIYGFDDALETT